MWFNKKPNLRGKPVMYTVNAMNGNVIMVAHQVRWPTAQQLERDALSELRRQSRFNNLFEKYSSNGRKETLAAFFSEQNKPNIDVINDPLSDIAKRTGLSNKQLLKLNGERLFTFRTTYSLSPYGQPSPAECSCTYFFFGDIPE